MAAKTIKAALKRCQEAITNYEWAEATREVELVLSFEPSSYLARLFKGKILTEKQSFKAAEGIYAELIKEEPSKIQAYLGLTHLFKATKEFQKLLDANCSILDNFSKYEKRSALLCDSLDLASSLENWQVYFRLYRELDEAKRVSILAETWDRVPFQKLTENDVCPPAIKSKKNTVFSLWLNGSVGEESVPDEWMDQFHYECGTGTSIEAEHPLKRISKLLESFDGADGNSVDNHKSAVTCRQELQAIEKFDFILARKNLAGRDVGDNFVVFFKPKEMAQMLKIIILELTLFRSIDLYTAEEILNEVSDDPVYDIYRTEFKYQKGVLKTSEGDIKQFILELQQAIPVQLKEFINQKALPCIKAKWLIRLDFLELASEMLDKDESKSYLKTKLEGIISYKHGKVKAANKLLLKSAKENSSDWETFYFIALTYLDQNDKARAIKCLKKSNQLQFNLPSFELLSEHLAPTESLDLLESAPKYFQNQPFFQKRLAMAYLELQKYESGMRVYQKLSTVAKDQNPVYLDGLGNCYAGLGSFSAAIRTFKKALNLVTDREQENHLLFRLSQLEQANLDFSAARETLEKLAERNYPLAFIELAEVWSKIVRDYFDRWLFELGGDYAQKALIAINRALQSGYADSACLWKKAADIFQMVASYVENLTLHVPTIFIKQNLSEELDSVQAKDCCEIAIRCYKKVANILPKEAKAQSDLSMAYFRAGKQEKADLAAKKALLLSRTLSGSARAECWNRMGIICTDSDPKLAQHSFCTAIASKHDFTEAWSNLGIFYFKNNNMKLANQAFSRAQSADPENATAWLGQAEIARTIGDSDCVDLSRHSSELVSRQASLAYAYYIAKQVHEQNETVLMSALTNIQRAANAFPLTPAESRVLAVLAEKLKYYKTAATAWEAAGNKIHAARALSKYGEKGLALQLISEFEGTEVEDENFHIANILMNCEEYEMAGEFFKKVLDKNASHQFAKLYCGIMYLRQGLFDEAKTYLFEVFTRAPGFLKQKAIQMLAVIGYLLDDHELMEAVAKEASKLGPEYRDLALDINVRAAVVRGELTKAKTLCSRAIMRNPLNQKPRILLAKILLKYDQSNPAIARLIHDDTRAENVVVATSTKLALAGKSGFKAHKAVAAARHKLPWDMSVKNAFAASFDNIKSAEHLRPLGTEINYENIKCAEKVQKVYFNEIATGQDSSWTVWALCGLMRLSGCTQSDISKEVVRRLESEEIGSELQMPVLATLATLAKPGEELRIQNIPINVSTITALIEESDKQVPTWLPDLLGAKAAADNMLEEALQALLLGFENSANKYKVYEVLVEALELIKVGGEEKERKNCLEICEILLKKLSDYERDQPMGRLFEGLLAMYSGDEAKGLSILGKLSRLRGTGAWRSATRFFLAGFYKANPKMAKKLKDLFKNEDPNDPIFFYSKKVHNIE